MPFFGHWSQSYKNAFKNDNFLQKSYSTIFNFINSIFVLRFLIICIWNLSILMVSFSCGKRWWWESMKPPTVWYSSDSGRLSPNSSFTRSIPRRPESRYSS